MGNQQPQLDWSNQRIMLDSLLASRFTQVYRGLDHFGDAGALSRLKKGCNPLVLSNLLTVDPYQTHLAMVIA
ncbi:MAG: hypothetical protein ACLGID_14010 [Gammaproteobacteria bacterium]|jgi:metallo-beta-lactamase family protein|uniref:hypothetical protein n=1 Tax=uncultured Pseudomonas sp. TaxID=114707 RepID=UPI0030D96A62